MTCIIVYLLQQSDRADNILIGTKWEMVEQIRRDIRDFKQKKQLDKVNRKLLYVIVYLQVHLCIIIYLYNM